MGLIQNIWDNLKGVNKAPNPLDQYIMKLLANNAVYPEQSNEFYLNSYCGNNDVFTVINKITEPASTVPIFQYDKDGEIVEGGRMLERLNNPNGYQSRSQFIEAALSFFLIFGESFTAYETVDNGINKGVPLRLDQLPPQWVQLVLDSYFNPIKGYSFYPLSGNNNTVPDYPKEKVLHWKEFNPDYSLTGGHLRGMSRLRPLIKSITGSTEGYNSLVKAFQSQGMWGIVTMLDPESRKAVELTKEQKSKLRSEFERDSKKGKLTISNAVTEYTKMGLTVVELDILRALPFLGGKLTDAYNLPDQLFAGSLSKTYSNMKEAERAAWENARKPSLDAYLEGLSKLLAPHFPGEEEDVLKADYSGIEVMQANMVELIQWMMAAQCFTKNQLLEATGFEKSNDPAMDVVLVSAGSIPISDIGNVADPQVVENALKSLKISDYRK